MANVESMIVEEKPQTKQIDREKVCMLFKENNCNFYYFFVFGHYFVDLPITPTCILFHWPSSFRI